MIIKKIRIVIILISFHFFYFYICESSNIHNFGSRGLKIFIWGLSSRSRFQLSDNVNGVICLTILTIVLAGSVMYRALLILMIWLIDVNYSFDGEGGTRSASDLFLTPCELMLWRTVVTRHLVNIPLTVEGIVLQPLCKVRCIPLYLLPRAYNWTS